MTQQPAVSAVDLASTSEVEELAQGAQPADFHEARRFPRFPYQARLEVAVYPFEGGGEPVQYTMLARDLSRGGINLLHTDPLLLGQKLSLQFNEAGARFTEVMWCRRLAHRCYSIGCRFIKINSGQTGGGGV